MKISNLPKNAPTRHAQYSNFHELGVSSKSAIGERLFDIIGSLAILTALMPFIALIALIMIASDRGPVLFRHERVGRRGRSFPCMKFRTMKTNGDSILEEHFRNFPAAKAEWEQTQKLRHDPRVTRIGSIMRKLSIDEIPQLFNVLRGDMSLVGPRPIVEQEIGRYGPNFEYYCHVRPGMTGVWQISGRSNLSYKSRVAMDVSYVRKKSILLDLYLVAKTIPAMIFIKGAF